jgi:hypothetical protein
VPLDRLIDAMTDLASGRIAAKAMVVPHRSSDGPGPENDNENETGEPG